MNAEALGGFTDWRVPTKDELLGIRDCNLNPCLDPIFGPNQSDVFYWSATENVDRPDFAEGIIFDPLFSNGLGDLFKKNLPPVRAVRGGL